MPLVTHGKARHQAEAIIGDAVANVVAYAREAGKPMLDFGQRTSEVEGQSCGYSRMMSSFSYGKVKAHFLSRSYQ